MKRNGIAGILAAVLLSAWSLPAGAEETYKLDPVLVTAEKRTENVQDVPVSVTAISEQQIKDSGIRSIQDVARQVPNLFIANWGFRGNSYAFIRGIGAVNNDPAIGFYVDDVNYMDSRVFDTNLFDIERIEVLRGPQGTLYGRNSLGGVVNIVTKKPDNEFHYGLEQTVGNENLYETTLHARAAHQGQALLRRIRHVGADGRLQHKRLSGQEGGSPPGPQRQDAAALDAHGQAGRHGQRGRGKGQRRRIPADGHGSGRQEPAPRLL
jgi:outer membrane receptor protein involved in Fe transport